MNEEARKARNVARIAELHPKFGARMRRVITSLEKAGLRPRIQDAWRSPEAQAAAFDAGNSKLRFGFHNVVGPGGAPEGLAVDLLDDDFPLNSRLEYLLRLAGAARRAKCNTGVDWGLPQALRDAVNGAIASKDWTAKVKIGWDPTHVEPADVTLAEVKAGKRPK